MISQCSRVTVASLLLILGVCSMAQAEDKSPTNRTLSTSPTFTFDARQLLATGYSDASQALAELVPNLLAPKFYSPDASSHAQRLFVKGGAADQLLVLIDGKRRHKSALLNLADGPGRGVLGADLSTIAFGSIERIEVYLGAQAATLGGDALHAVLNVVLRDGDAANAVSIQYGLNSGELRGVRELAGVDTSQGQIDLLTAGDRNVDDGDGETLWASGSWGFDVGEDGFLRLGAEVRDQESTNRSAFDARAQYARLPGGEFDIREATANRLNSQAGQGDSRRINVLMNTQLAISDQEDFYGRLTIGTLTMDTFADFVRPVDERNSVELFPDGFLPEIRSNIDDRGFLFGVLGERFGWQYDLYMNIGENEVDLDVRQTLNPSIGSLSPTQFSVGNNESREKQFGIKLWKTFPGAVPIEVEWGLFKENEDYEVERSDTGSTLEGGRRSTAGRLLVPEVQGIIPFRIGKLDESRDQSVAFAKITAQPTRDWRLSAGGRFTDSSMFGSLFNLDVAASYQLSERGSVHTSISIGDRQPSLVQSVYARSTLSYTQDDQLVEFGMFRPTDEVALALGGGELTQERFFSTRSGVRFQLAAELPVELTLYYTKVDDAVILSESLQGPAVIDLLAAAGFPQYSGGQYFYNGAEVTNYGADVSLGYRWRLASFGDVQLSLRANYNRTQARSLSSGALSSDLSDVLNEQRFTTVSESRLERTSPKLTMVGSAHWQRDRFDMLVRAVHYGDLVDAETNQQLAAETLISLVLGYQATPKTAIRFGVHNGFDAYPKIVNSAASDRPLEPYSRYAPQGSDGRFVFLRLESQIF